MNAPLRLSTVVLLVVGTADLLSTIFWLKNGGQEGNPLFAWLAHLGLFALIFGKLLFLAGPVAILEYARKSHPRTAEFGTWAAAGLYVALLALHMRASFG